MVLFFSSRKLVPDIGEKFEEASYVKISYKGLVASTPLAIFSIMYQPKLPIVYRELKNQNYKTMQKIMVTATIFVLIVYYLASPFGYLGLVNSEKLDTLMEKQNILEVKYNNWAFTVAIMLLIFSVSAAAPLNILPAKDSFEDICFKGKEMSTKWNIIISVGICAFCWLVAVSVVEFSFVLRILGSTINSFIGFILPILFHYKIVQRKKDWRHYAERVI